MLFLAQITTSGICVCCAIFNLTFVSIRINEFRSENHSAFTIKRVWLWPLFQATTDDILQLQLNVAVLVYGIFDIFVTMFLVNEITLVSSQLSYCLFQSNWTVQSETCKKCVLIVSEVLKKPQELTILIYPLNLETFKLVSQGTFS